MQLARDWSQLIAEHPEGLSSQRQAFKVFAAIARAEEKRQPQAIASQAAARSAKASGKGAARCAFAGKCTRTGPVWRAAGPLVSEAFRLVNSVDETLSKLVSRGYPLELAAHRWAAASAGAAVYHTIGAGHTLLHARELCDEGGWLRWLRKNFDGSVRTAQRSMRVARRVPASKDRCDKRVA